MRKIIREINLQNNNLSRKEWLVTNGLGGYASGTISGLINRRYHALLISALPAPLGRIIMLNTLNYNVKLEDEREIDLGYLSDKKKEHEASEVKFLEKFYLEDGLPVWNYKFGTLLVEKRIMMPYMQNTVVVNFKMLTEKSSLQLKINPFLHFRLHELPVDEKFENSFKILADKNRFEIFADEKLPKLHLYIYGKDFSYTNKGYYEKTNFYQMEYDRGYASEGKLWSAGFFHAELNDLNDITFIASTEEWDTILALQPKEIFETELKRREDLILKTNLDKDERITTELALAADQFIITPVGRQEKAIKIISMEAESKSVIAGYHWFTDWGRDTMISLEGLTLSTRRFREAEAIIKSFANCIKEGLIPNLFPEGEKEGLYHTADATLWFFHAIDRYLFYTNDENILSQLLPVLKEIIKFHLEGTMFGIKTDSEDGLLKQGEAGYQLTWMDAKVGNWVVTPRRGKAVEINSLWYNALRLIDEWIKKDEETKITEYFQISKLTKKSFNEKFWCEEKKYLYDVIEGESNKSDYSLRPNQIFSISLKYPVLDEDKWELVINTIRENLLTPYGLRSLGPNHPDYKTNYFGNLLSRDAAYHQGTVWTWLIGHFIDAWLKLYPEDYNNPEKFLEGFKYHLSDACIGSISEIFDADEPYIPRGCIAQAWSVAEVLRSHIKINSLKKEIKKQEVTG